MTELEGASHTFHHHKHPTDVAMLARSFVSMSASASSSRLSHSIAASTDASPSSPSTSPSSFGVISPPTSPSPQQSLAHSKPDASAGDDGHTEVALVLRGETVKVSRRTLTEQSSLFRSALPQYDAAAAPLTYHLPAQTPFTAAQVREFVRLMTDVSALTAPSYQSLDTETLLRLAKHFAVVAVTRRIDALLTAQYKHVRDTWSDLQTHVDTLILAHTFALTQLAVTVHMHIAHVDAAFFDSAHFADGRAQLDGQLFDQCNTAIDAAKTRRRIRPGGSIM